MVVDTAEVEWPACSEPMRAVCAEEWNAALFRSIGSKGMKVLENIRESLNSISLSAIIEGIIVILAVISISAIFGKLYRALMKLLDSANKYRKIAIKAFQKYKDKVKRRSKYRARFSQDEVDSCLSATDIENPKVAEFVLFDNNSKKYYALYNEESVLIIDPTYGERVRRYDFDKEGIPNNELSIIQLALKNRYFPVFPKRTFWSRRKNIDDRYFSVDSKDTSLKLNEIYTTINVLEPILNWHLFDFRALTSENRILDVAVGENGNSGRIVYLDPSFGDWIDMKVLDQIHVDNLEKSIIKYLKSLEFEIIYPTF